MSTDTFVPPPEPRYVDRNGRPRQPEEHERIEHKRKVIFAKAEHLGWGRFTGTHSVSNDPKTLMVRMEFERGSDVYFVSAED